MVIPHSYLRWMASGAIAAMREPTLKMTSAMLDALAQAANAKTRLGNAITHEDMAIAFRAGCDAALAEKVTK